MTYPYGTKGAPVVGNGLGGLPRRAVVATTEVPASLPVTPYSKYELGQGPGGGLYSYDARIRSGFGQYSDGTWSDNMVYFTGDGLRFITPISTSINYNGFQKRHTRGDITSIPIIINRTNYTITGVDDNSFVAVQSSAFTETAVTNSLFLKNESSSVYYFFDARNKRIDRLTKTSPANTVLTWTAGRLISGFNTAITAVMRSNGQIVVFGANTTTSMCAITFDADLVEVSNVTFAAPTAFVDLAVTNRDIAAFSNTTMAIRWGGGAGTSVAYYFVYDVETQLGRFTNYTYPGEQNPQNILFRNETDVFMLVGAGSGGSFGQTVIYTLTATRDVSIGSVTSYSSTSASSFVSSFYCIQPDLITTMFYNGPDAVRSMNFRPFDVKSFTFSGITFAFSPSSTARTPAAGVSAAVAHTAAASFNNYTNVSHFRRDLVPL